MAFPDLVKEGALLTLSFVVPFDVLDGEGISRFWFGDGGTQYDLEATYNFPVNDNLSILLRFTLSLAPTILKIILTFMWVMCECSLNFSAEAMSYLFDF